MTLASSVRSDRARTFGVDVEVNGIDPTTIGQFYSYRWTQGSSRSLVKLGQDGAVVKKRFADAHHLTLGSKLTLTTSTGTTRVFRITGIHDPPVDQIDSVLGDVAVSQRGSGALTFGGVGVAFSEVSDSH